MLANPVITTWVRILPKEYNTMIAMRVEILGCLAGMLTTVLWDYCRKLNFGKYPMIPIWGLLASVLIIVLKKKGRYSYRLGEKQRTMRKRKIMA